MNREQAEKLLAAIDLRDDLDETSKAELVAICRRTTSCGTAWPICAWRSSWPMTP
jgi:hypothetical protein